MSDLFPFEIPEDLKAACTLYDSMYSADFAEYFDGQYELFERLKSEFKPMSDEELENLLTTTPLNLYAVAERLNRYRLISEMLKLKVKDIENTIKRFPGGSDAELDQLSETLSELKLKSVVCDKVVLRVEGEISFCRELIMTAKKIWDGRRDAEGANPIRTDVSPEDAYDSLPVY